MSKTDWTIMVYMAGDNNLSEECVYNLTEIKEGLPGLSNVRVIAQFDPSGAHKGTRRYELTPIGSRTLEKDADATGWSARETNTGEPQSLLDFIRWGRAAYEASNYMVVLVGHGSGTADDFLLRDENPPDSLSILELQSVFKAITDDGQNPDNEEAIAILGMDTCLMNMAEVCYQLGRTSIKYIVGSEGFSPNTGWPYKSILTEMKKLQAGGASVTPEQLSSIVVDEYTKFYSPYDAGGISVDQAVLVREKCPDLAGAVSELACKLLAEIKAGELGDYLRPDKPKQNALLLAHWETQSYNGEVFVDLYDFCENLKRRYNAIGDRGKVPIACDKVMTEVKGFVKKSCHAGAAFQYSYGVSIYFPWANVSTNYDNLAFPLETKWLDFLNEYTRVTRRPSKNVETKDTGRASVPTNKGRDGKVESMRNPPIVSSFTCNIRGAQAVNGGGPPSLSKARKSPAKKARRKA